MGVAYWAPLLDQLHRMVAEGTIDAVDLRLFLATDDVEKAMAHLRTHAIERFGLRPRVPGRSRVLGEPRLRKDPGSVPPLASRV
jgi:hypothetical protein